MDVIMTQIFPRFRAARWLIAAAIVTLLAACGQLTAPAPEPTATPAANTGTAFDPPRPLTDWTFPSTRGEPLSLSDLQGKPTLLFFGYTNCPDFCPAALGDFKQIRAQLGDRGDDVQFVFVSVDADRDTPEALKRYVEFFDPSFIGLAGDDATLEQISPEYGLYYKRRDIEGTAAGYFVDHTVVTYLIDEQSRLAKIYSYQVEAETIAADLQARLAGS
jgi:protein SCO1